MHLSMYRLIFNAIGMSWVTALHSHIVPDMYLITHSCKNHSIFFQEKWYESASLWLFACTERDFDRR